MTWIVTEIMLLLRAYPHHGHINWPSKYWLKCILHDYMFKETFHNDGFSRGLFSWMLTLWVFIILKTLFLTIRSATSRNSYRKLELMPAGIELIVSAASFVVGFFFMLLLFLVSDDIWWGLINFVNIFLVIPILYMDIKRTVLKIKYRPKKSKRRRW